MVNGILDLEGTVVLERNINALTRFVRNEGSARSSKSTSIAQAILLILLQETGLIVTISRKTRPALKASAEKDFLDQLKANGFYNDRNHNKTEGTYEFRGNLIYFLSVDQATKLKSRKHNIVWLNEADEFDKDDFIQFNLRMSAPRKPYLAVGKGGKMVWVKRPNQMFLDYNPPDEDDHWVYTEFDNRKDCTTIKSDFYDNGFLDEATIDELERLRDSDPEYWQRYGLGLRAVRLEKIYAAMFRTVPEWPEELTDYTYGLDFGYNHPTALTKCGYVDAKGKGLYWKEEIYQSFLTGPSLIELMNSQGIDRYATIYADPSRPDIIEEISDAGYTIEAAENEVYNGIMRVKAAGLNITQDSPNLIKEAKKYSWKKNPKSGSVTDQPIKAFDDGMDSGRYGSYPLTTGHGVIKYTETKLIRRHRR